MQKHSSLSACNLMQVDLALFSMSCFFFFSLDICKNKKEKKRRVWPFSIGALFGRTLGKSFSMENKAEEHFW